jgi:hypothetical protein
MLILALVALTLSASPILASGQGGEAFKLEGAWISRVTAMDGVPTGTALPFQWSFVMAPSPDGRRATIHGSVEVGFPELLDFNIISPLVGQIVETSPSTASFNSVWYLVKKGSLVDQIVAIGTATGETREVGRGRSQTVHHFAFYLASADANGDGLPDDDDGDGVVDAAPIAAFNVTTMDTRLPLPF